MVKYDEFIALYDPTITGTVCVTYIIIFPQTKSIKCINTQGHKANIYSSGPAMVYIINQFITLPSSPGLLQYKIVIFRSVSVPHPRVPIFDESVHAGFISGHAPAHSGDAKIDN
jgi:hypothetical protein